MDENILKQPSMILRGLRQPDRFSHDIFIRDVSSTTCLPHIPQPQLSSPLILRANWARKIAENQTATWSKLPVPQKWCCFEVAPEFSHTYGPSVPNHCVKAESQNHIQIFEGSRDLTVILTNSLLALPRSWHPLAPRGNSLLPGCSAPLASAKALATSPPWKPAPQRPRFFLEDHGALERATLLQPGAPFR